jgi:hypothetical protein
MNDIIAVDYAVEFDLPHGAKLTHIPNKRISFSLNEILLLGLDTSPSKPPYFNFSHMNSIWRFANSRSSDVFLDVWMATAIALKLKDREIWEDFRYIFCPGTVIPTNGSSSWIMPVLERKDGNLWSTRFVSNCHPIDKKASAIGYIRPGNNF